jgi:hypothetical protein
MKENTTTTTFINNTTTTYILKGVSEAGATVKITSNDLNLFNQTIPLDSDGNFTYNLNIPLDVNKSTIEIEATHEGKKDDYVNLTIKRH